ncbi:MAG TPA: hypothetical protein VFX53_07040 [Pedococcus sp.]|nr:hypothetical protein [Pedococcus sp.]
MRDSRWWGRLAMGALATAAALLFAPTGATESCSASTAGPLTCTSGTTSMLASEGLWVLAPLCVPALACLLPVALRSPLTARLVAVGLFAYCFLTGFTIGLFFVPVAVAALVLALRRRSAAPSAPSAPSAGNSTA